jgi:SNW domain-containing protein 1
MATMAGSLQSALPKPRYTGEDEEAPAHTRHRGPRVVGAGELDETQLVLKRSGPPAYGQRSGWRPRSQEDFGDGGAFPEVPVAQYPLEMGKKGGSTSNALAVQVNADGKVKYDAIARQGHTDSRIIHTSFKDLITLRQRADAGEIDLARPDKETVEATTERTKNALAALVSGAVAAQKPKNVNIGSRKDPTFVRYTPANQMGDNSKKQDRIMKIVERQRDPMEPPKFKHKKIPRGPPSPPRATCTSSASSRSRTAPARRRSTPATASWPRTPTSPAR